MNNMLCYEYLWDMTAPSVSCNQTTIADKTIRTDRTKFVAEANERAKFACTNNQIGSFSFYSDSIQLCICISRLRLANRALIVIKKKGHSHFIRAASSESLCMYKRSSASKFFLFSTLFQLVGLRVDLSSWITDTSIVTKALMYF